MLVGVISDTHDDLEAVAKASRIFVEKGVGIVLHLGDIVSPFTLSVFKSEGVEKLIAVYGNNCGEKLGLARVASQLGYSIEDWPRLVELDGRKILMLHGTGPAEKTRSLAESFARSGDYDAVLYGHTHQVDIRRIGRTLLLNPGTACGCLAGRKTIAIIDTETMEAEIIEI